MKFKHVIILILLITFQQVKSQSPIVQSATETDFCTALQQIVADYPNNFENLKGEKITDEKSWKFFYMSMVNPEGVVLGRIIDNTYQAYFTWETEDHILALDTFNDVKQMLEACRLPFRLKIVRDEEDGFDREIVYRPEGAKEAFTDIQFMILIQDFWFIGIDVSLNVMKAE